MPISNGAELRAAYLEYFKSKAHPVIPSAPLIPPDDPTLLFTSAGMVQFKALYSGTVHPMPYTRAASCQKCLRAGGKGSDLENVGKTLRHHTFFEMLGNFSFGDYFKEEAIGFAWEFITSKQWMNLPADRIFATIYGPTDAEIDVEAESYWKALHVPNAVIPLDAKENFWGPAGETGACGPCSEIKFFMGSDEELREVQRLARRDMAGAREVGQRIVDEGDLFLEIWNLVFPQYDQQRDGSRPLLRNRGIDTGAGLERMTTALERAEALRSGHPGRFPTQYTSDLFAPITRAVAEAVGVDYVADAGREAQRIIEGTARRENSPLDRRVHCVNAIADHARTLVFCLAEGITPSNLGRGYVVRRIARRALRFAALTGREEPFLASLYDAVVEAMGGTYPEIKANPDFIRRALHIEEETFLRTRERGQRLLDELLAQARDNGTNAIRGEDAFKLWDTYGFPFDLTREVAEDHGVRVDEAGYEAVRKAQKEAAKQARRAAPGSEADAIDAVAKQHGATEFTGYTWHPHAQEARVLAIIEDGRVAEEVGEADEVLVVLDRSPFYAESGGQVGDTGVLATPNARLTVLDVQKTPGGTILHRARVEVGSLGAGEAVEAVVDARRRQSIVRHHSAVHLLQNALKRIVGPHVTQAGSFVGPDYARFDFTHTEGVAAGQLREIQEAVNELILEDHEVVTEVMPLEEARRKGAIAPFGEKYGARVRVVTMGPSVEFCGGVHVAHTSQSGRFRIVAESSVASGVRRIEAVVGAPAVRMELAEQYGLVGPLQALLAAKGTEALERVKVFATRMRDLDREVAALRRELATVRLGDAADRAATLPDGTRLLSVRVDGFDGGELRAVAEQLRQKLGDESVCVVGGEFEGRVNLVVAVGKGAVSRHNAGRIVGALAAKLDGKGGGKPDLAQAGARNVGKLDEVLAAGLP